MACLYNVEIEDVVKADYILFLEDTNIAIYVQVLQKLLPHVKTNDANDISQSLLEHGALPVVLICTIQCTLDYD